jgi:hypothetical protein
MWQMISLVPNCSSGIIEEMTVETYLNISSIFYILPRCYHLGTANITGKLHPSLIARVLNFVTLNLLRCIFFSCRYQ